MPQPNITTPEQALLQLRAGNSTPEAKLKAASFLILQNHFAHYREVIEVLRPLESHFSENVEWLYCVGYALVTKHEPAASIPYLLRSIRYIQNNAALYTALTWAYLQVDDFGNAFLTSSAGLHNCEEKGTLPSLQYLSRVRFEGHRVVAFPKQGIDFKYALFTSNTQEIEAALHHLTQQFTEQDELEMLREHLGQVNSIAEVGCLVGNHSVYFLHTFQPQRMKIMDASRVSLEHARENLELNLTDSSPLEVDYVHTAIGRESGTLRFFDEQVPVNSLSNLLTEPFDFLKIDVDGMEMEALEGAESYLLEYQPRVMIEVLHDYKSTFEAFLQRVRYHIVSRIERPHYSNYLIAPESRQS